MKKFLLIAILMALSPFAIAEEEATKDYPPVKSFGASLAIAMNETPTLVVMGESLWASGIEASEELEPVYITPMWRILNRQLYHPDFGYFSRDQVSFNNESDNPFGDLPLGFREALGDDIFVVQLTGEPKTRLERRQPTRQEIGAIILLMLLKGHKPIGN